MIHRTLGVLPWVMVGVMAQTPVPSVKTMYVETVIEYASNSTVLPQQFDTATSDADKEGFKNAVHNAVGQRTEEILKSLGFFEGDFEITDYSYSEHYNPWRSDYANKARVNYKITHWNPILDQLRDAAESFAEQLGNSQSGSDDWSFVADATSTSEMLFNPCNSPFMNDCDPNAVCEGIRQNQWFNARSVVGGYFHQYAAFYTCECNDGFINHRQYTDDMTMMWYLKGSVCMENKYVATKLGRIWDLALLGLIALSSFLLLMIICYFVMACYTKKYRKGWKENHRRRWGR